MRVMLMITKKNHITNKALERKQQHLRDQTRVQFAIHNTTVSNTFTRTNHAVSHLVRAPSIGTTCNHQESHSKHPHYVRLPRLVP